MANSVISTVAHDGARNVLIEVTGILDTSDYAQADITTISGLTPVPTNLRLDTIQFAIQDTCAVMLWWHDTAGTSLIASLAGRGRLDFGWFGGRNNPNNAGYTGNIQVSTQGWLSGAVLHWTLLLDCIKQGA
jgi:hypothetical protein